MSSWTPADVGARRVFAAASLAAFALVAQSIVAQAAGTADLTLTMTGPATATAGTNITYLMTITNNGPASADGISFSPTPPAHTSTVSFTFTAGQPSLTIAPGAITAVTWVVHIDATTPPGVITNTQTITTTTPLPNPAHNTATVLTAVGAGARADLAVTKTATVSRLTGDRFSSHITVVNDGPQGATSVVVVDNLPAGLTGVTVATSGTSVGLCTKDLAGHINCHVAAMQLGQTFILDVSGIAAAPGDYTDTATASSATPDPNLANNVASATTHVLPRTSDGDGRVGDDNGESGNVDHGDQGSEGDHGDQGSGGQRGDRSE